MTAYTLDYCRRSVTYTLKRDDGGASLEFRPPWGGATNVFTYLANHMDPGDTLHWLEEAD